MVGMNRIALASTFSLALALSTPALAADDTGARLYFNHCAACHGDDAEGTGPVAASMRVTVPNLRTLAQRSGGVFPVDAVTAYVDGRDVRAAHGDRQMPVWGDVFRGAEQSTAQRVVRRRIAALVDFISTLQYR
jgi:mono/diheme cytochrome c family protein